MIGRQDLIKVGRCTLCKGEGRDPKCRKRKCSKCFGDGKKLVCGTCGEDMPCFGTRNDVFDQSSCLSGERGEEFERLIEKRRTQFLPSSV